MEFEQLSIFDFLKPETTETDIELLPVEEIARIIGERIGLSFCKDKFGYYSAKANGTTFEISKENYLTDDERFGKAFIGCGWERSHSGGGSPIDSIEEAVGWFKKKMKNNELEDAE